ncbi:MAG TPA: transglycosylase domain-containing protein, partial [Myxococcaceae bacterium]|nr:transglycosylase domain-containing protein [Myxococcaceae bacterium]
MGCALALVLICAGVWIRWMSEGAELARAHASFEQTHRGWSFPGRIFASSRGERMVTGWLIGPDAEIREHLPLERAPRHLLDAIVAAEDREFRSHDGVNVKAAVRALIANVRGGSYSQGGSTLTMQVVRSLSQRREKTLWRKLREVALAFGLERELGKDGVLSMYLDIPYLGQAGDLSVCGFAVASRFYFGKSASELSLSEAATLAAILPAPARFSPRQYPALARERRDRVLQAMKELFGYDVTASVGEPVRSIARPYWTDRHPSVLSAVRSELERRFGKSAPYSHGLEVDTGIELQAQEEAEKLFTATLARYESILGASKAGPLEAAGVAIDVQTGLVRSIFAGTDATSTGFNRATQARRQPGSAFKPLVYALAFDSPPGTRPRFTAASVEPNEPRDFKTPTGIWRPRNVGGLYTPTASLAYALSWSQNVATASLLERLGGPRPLIALASRLGVDTTRFPEELGIAFGQAEVTLIEMAQVVAAIANGGYRVDTTHLLRVRDGAGRELLEAAPSKKEPVLNPQAAALTRELMRLVVEAGTGGAVRGAGGQPGYRGLAIGKTGTTDAEKDLWFVGATPQLAMVVWLGYDRPKHIGASASDLAAPLWGAWMRRLAHPEQARAFDWGPSLVYSNICTVTGMLAGPDCTGIS